MCIFDTIWCWLQIAVSYKAMVRHLRIFCIIIRLVIGSGSPIYDELSLSNPVPNLVKTHIHWSWLLLFQCFFVNLSAVKLSVHIGVDGCSWPNYLSVVWVTTASCPLKNKPAYSASAAEAMMWLRGLLAVCKGPLGFGGLSGGFVGSMDALLRKKWPPTRLLAFHTDRYDVSLSTWSTILLAWYLILSDRWVVV